MTNVEFHQLQLQIRSALISLENKQAQYKDITGQKYILGQGIGRLQLCCDCCFAVNTGNVPASWSCACEESPFFDQDVHEGCSEFADL